jgi:hypothetical protein
VTTLTVTDTSNDPADPGSLAFALTIAQNGDVIDFATGLAGQTITLDTVLHITTSVTIEGHIGGGQGAPDIALSGGNVTSVFSIASDAFVQLDGLAIVNGFGLGAAGLSGTNETAGVGGQGGGGMPAAGGIYNAGLLLASNLYFAGDTAVGGTGGAGGYGSLGGGGGGAGGNAAAAVFNAPGAGTIWDGATVSFAGDYAMGGAGGSGGAWIGSSGYAPGGAGGGPGYAGQPGGNYPAAGGAGGQPGYAGSPGHLDLSLTGGGGGGGGGGQSISGVGFGNSIEVNGPTDLVTNTGDDSATPGTLRYEIAHANAGDTIIFDPSLAGQTITLSTPLDITKTLAIEGHIGGGSGAPDIAISGGGATGLLTIETGALVRLDGLTLENGGEIGATGTAGTNDAPTGGTGGVGVGGIANFGELIVSNAGFFNNAGIGGVGGIGSFTLGGGGGGGAGGFGAGAIYNFLGSRLYVDVGTVSFSGNAGTGGVGGQGGAGQYEPNQGLPFPLAGGYGGLPGQAGQDGSTVSYVPAAKGGQPGQAGYDGTVASLLGGLVITSGGGGGGGLSAANIGGVGNVSYVAVTCFAAGVALATPFGDRAVETLAPGDAVLTKAGETRPVRWIGHRALDCASHPRPDLIWPVRVRADALATGVPTRDVLLSPDHAVLVDGALVPIRLLANGATIAAEPTERVTYFHVELDCHDLLMAEGLAAESYLDTGNRGLFDNAVEPLILHPDFSGETKGAQARRERFSCAPLLCDPTRLEALWHRLADRAVGLGHPRFRPCLTEDPDLRLSAGGRVLRPAVADGDRHVFVLPPGIDSVRIVSRVAVPAHAEPWKEDRRRLGVMMRRITAAGPDGPGDIPLDHPGLGAGWWDAETDGASLWRWTRGAAVLPLPPGTRLLELWIDRRSLRYAHESAPDAAQRVQAAA